MSNSDFEVMPLGTMVEIRELRKLVNELIEISRSDSQETNSLIRSKINQIRDFYLWHSEKYPVTV